MTDTADNIIQPTPKQKKRHPEIMLSGAVFCFFVLFIHAASEIVSAGTEGSAIYAPVAALWRMCGCATQGFVFLAGLRFAVSQKRSDKEFKPLKYVFSRFLRILPLYLAWCAIYYAYNILISGEGFYISDFFGGVLLGDIAPHLYFIPIILQFAVIAPFSLLLRKKLPAAFILPAAVLITSVMGDCLPDLIGVIFPQAPYFEYSDRIFTSFLIFWSAGCCAGEEYDSFVKTLDNAKGVITACFLLAAALDLGAVYYSFVLNRFVWCIKQIQTLYVLTAIIFVMMISRAATRRTSAPLFLQKADLASYSIYLSHILPLWLIQLGIDKLGLDLTCGFFIRLAVLLVWALILSAIYGQRLYRIHASSK